MIAVFLVLQLAIVFTGAQNVGILLENKTGLEIHSVTVVYNIHSTDGAAHAHVGHLAVNESEFVIIRPSEEYGSPLQLEIQPEENGVIEHKHVRASPSWRDRGWVRITLGAGFSVESFDATVYWGAGVPFLAFSDLGWEQRRWKSM